MRQASLMPLVDPTWLNVLRAEAAKPKRSKKDIGDELGVSRTAISLLCAGKYSAGMNKVQAKIAHKVMALYGQQVWCPHVRDAITPGTCESHREAPMAKSDPAKLKQWLACRSCPQNPENQKKPEAANAV